MAKKKIIRKSNRPLTFKVPNYYGWGGDFKAALGGSNPFDLKSTFSGGNVANMLKGGLAGAIGGAVGNIAGGAIGGGLKSGAGSAISSMGSTIGGAVGAVNPILGGIVSAGSGILGGVTNALFGSKINREKVNEIEASNKGMNTLVVDSSSNNSILDQWASQDFGTDFSRSDIGRDGLFSNKAKNKYKELKKKQSVARNRALTAFEGAVDSADTQSDLNVMSNFAAYGGPINIYGSGAIDYELAKEDLYNKQLSAMSKYKMSSMPNSFGMPELAVFAKGGKIHIKKANRGKFTDYCGGKVTSECIARGKRSKSAAVRKRATFAANARKWHHAFGGYLYDEGGNLHTSVPNIGQHGGDFSNGVTIIGNGGTHEENPMEGVPMGVAPDGTPNLVEQGEVKFNNYVFSNRLFATGGLLAAHNLPTTYADHSFADIAERLSKESSERPNDPISKRGLMSAMTRLQQAQEQVRMEENRSGNKYAHGGKMGRKYDGEGDEPNLLQFYTPQERWLRTLQRQGVIPTYELPAFKKPYGMMTPEERTASFNLEVPSLVDTRTPAERWMDENIKPIQFNPSAITDDTESDTDTEGSNTNSSRQGRGLTWLRYAPAVGAGLGVLTDALGWTNSPDYGNADLVDSAVDNLTNVEFTPIGNYLTYRPLDRNYYINKLNAQAGATRRAIVNQSGGNRATALAGLLAADYNAQNVLGDLARQTEEYNFNQRKEVETFNRGTNQFNSEMGLKASIANQANDKLRLQARTTQAQLRDQADARASAGRAANLTNLFDSLGEIGREEFSRNMIQSNPALYYSIDSNGNITYKNGYDELSEAEKKSVREAANRDKKRKKAKGGYLTMRGGEYAS